MNQEVAEAAHAFEIDQLGSQSAVRGGAAQDKRVSCSSRELSDLTEQEGNMCVSHVGKGSLKCSLKHWKHRAG